MADKEPAKVAQMAPDHDEDDLDDLDDVLDEFQAKPAPPPPTAPAAVAQPEKPPTGTADSDTAAEEQLAKQLQTGMADLIAELDNDPDMQKQFEAMMKELIAAGAAPSDEEAGAHLKEAAKAVPMAEPSAKAAPSFTASASASASASSKADPFGDTIRKTMERMQQSGDAATAASASNAQQSSEEDLLAQMMRELQSEGGGGEEDFNKMLMSMMTQLTNKEILYEPMKELHDRFPEWLEKNADKTPADDLKRYREQQTLVRSIVARFERKQYSDDNESDREYIVDKMQQMQAAGSPPPDLVGDMGAAQEALGDLDAGCPTQ